MISGVIETPLKQFEDNRGKVMHMLRCDDPHFKAFGETYFSWIYAGVVKAWKCHQEKVLNFAVPIGTIKLVLFDTRKDSPTYNELNEFYIGEDDYYLLTIPSNIWYGFSTQDQTPAMIVNCATLPHSPSEALTKDANDPSIPYTWELS